jgi:hypothetical protein
MAARENRGIQAQGKRESGGWPFFEHISLGNNLTSAPIIPAIPPGSQRPGHAYQTPYVPGTSQNT